MAAQRRANPGYYTVDGKGFDSFSAAVKYASARGSNVIEPATGITRWHPAAPAKKKRQHVLKDGKETPFSRVRNPGGAAAQAYEDFHGTPSEEVVTVKEKIHFHEHLAAAGELKRLVIIPPGQKGAVILSDFDGAVLAFNEQRNQLFVKGGNQSVPLDVFGIDPDEAHEVETLGAVKVIDYFTTKKHLGRDGGTAIYVHRFRTEERGGRTVIVKVLRWPDAIYYVRDKRIVFSGGSYTILPEGIDK